MDIIDLLPPQHQLNFAKHIDKKLSGVEEAVMVIQRLSEKDKLEYAKFSQDKVQNKFDLQRIIEELPIKDWQNYLKLVISKIQKVDDLKWLLVELKQSPEALNLIAVEIKNHTQSKERISENESTAILFQEFGVSRSTPRVIQVPNESKPANDPIINRDSSKKVSNSEDEISHPGSYKSGR